MMKGKSMWFLALAVYLAVQAAPVATLSQVLSEPELWQTLQRIALWTFLAVVLFLWWSVALSRWNWKALLLLPSGLKRLMVSSSLGLLVVSAVSFLPPSSTVATFGWLLLWTSAGIMCIWAFLSSRVVGDENTVKHRVIAVPISFILLVLLGWMSVPERYDPEFYMGFIRLTSLLMLFMSFFGALHLSRPDERTIGRLTTEEQDRRSLQAGEQVLLFSLLAISLIVYGYMKFVEVTSMGVALVCTSLVILNVGVIAWLVHQWRKAVP